MDLLREAELFISVRDAGSLREAARREGTTHATVSRRLRALERALGAPLFLRTTRALRVTEAGERFHREALRLLAAARRTYEVVRGPGEIRGTLVLSTSITYGLQQANAALAQLMAQHPGLTIHLRLEDRVVDLLDEGVDVAVQGGVVELDGSPYLIARQISDFAQRLVASPEYWSEGPPLREPSDLASHRLVGGVGLSLGSTLRFEVAGQPHEVEMRSRTLFTRTQLAVRDAALAGLGIAVLPDFVVQRDLREGTLVPGLVEARFPRMPISAVYRVERRGDPVIATLVESLRRHARSNPFTDDADGR
ncbi:MAG: LysR family transcriptional regulator [Myxococcales bacterium]|nr:LysR family transcriptional regulator [Myxococcales bacterium]